MSVPLIDVFAGPGGLGEGFSALRTRNGQARFRIALSVEKDRTARQTLKLRSFLRQFNGQVPDAYYQTVSRRDMSWCLRVEGLYKSYPREAALAESEAWEAELGQVDRDIVHDRIEAAIGLEETWVLIGGPPCQPYSLVGRARNSGNPKYVPEDDARQYLYIEYLQILADHSPAVFVMENVKGLLSATLNSQRIFDRMLEDLAHPTKALQRERRAVKRIRQRPTAKYRLFSLTKALDLAGPKVTDYLVRMEDYGIPQSRHRIIIVGVREDLRATSIPLIEPRARASVRATISDLPPLRSGLSREEDDTDSWISLIREARRRRWFATAARNGLKRELLSAIAEISRSRLDTGGDFLTTRCRPAHRPEWYVDERLPGVLHHQSKCHMLKDIYRYLFSACFAAAKGYTPTLKDFPADLLPEHKNVSKALGGGHFSDRFRVQLWDAPSTTITSHIAKDGHYFIHPDPTQCRALTPREAARLQTFPDNYFFCGPRTSQYMQIGNAVPPLLARDIAQVIASVLESGGAN